MNRLTTLKTLSESWRCRILWAILPVISFACQEDPDFTKEINAGSIDELIVQTGTLDPPEDAYLVELSVTSDSVVQDSDGTSYNCSAKEYEMNTVFETLTLSAFDDRAATNTASQYQQQLRR